MNRNDFRLIRSIVASNWHIHQASGLGLMPLAVKFISGELSVRAVDEDSLSQDKASSKELPSYARRYLSSFQFKGQSAEPYISERDTWYYDDFPVKVGDVVFIPVVGAITQYDYCGTAGTKTIASWYQKAEQDDSIKGIVEIKNSPGGDVIGTRALADLKTRISKPIIGFIDGMECSAAKYIGAADDYTFASSAECIIGSVGVMTIFQDWSGWYEENGVTVTDLYSKTSPLKNDAYRRAMKGDFKGYTDDKLFKIDQSFMGFMKANLPGISEEALKGADYLTEEAIANGLCDEIGTLDQAYEMARSGKKKDLSIKNTSPMSKKVTMLVPEILASGLKHLPGVEMAETPAAAAQEETAPEATAPEATAPVAAPETTPQPAEPVEANAEVVQLKAQLTAKTGEIATLTQQVTDLKNSLQALATTNPAAARTTARQEGDDVQPTMETSEKITLLTAGEVESNVIIPKQKS